MLDPKIKNLNKKTRDVLEMMYAVKLVYKTKNPIDAFKKIKESLSDSTFTDPDSARNFNIVMNHPTEKQLAIEIFQKYSPEQFDKVTA
jgi:hypothetical protein